MNLFEKIRISISEQDGTVWTDVQVYLVDRTENVVHNLTDTDYIFKSKEGVQNDRFTLLFKNTALGVSESQLQIIGIVPNPTTGNIAIVSPQTVVESVEVFDIRGRKLMTVDYDTANYLLDLSTLQSATYFVKINTLKGSVIKRVLKN